MWSWVGVNCGIEYGGSRACGVRSGGGYIGREFVLRAESGTSEIALSGVKRMGAVRRLGVSWRSLCGERGTGAGTVVACSGGADSVGLLVGLCAAKREGERVVVGHVVHDMRGQEESLGDRDLVRGLADRLGCGFAERAVQIGAGNAEGRAREGRYGALADIARAEGCGFVVTGHHADDQFETMIMALMRGASLDGLAGIAPMRMLQESVALVRPALHTTRDVLRSVCEEAGVGWCEDETNSDPTRLRSGLRHGAVAMLSAERVDAPVRAARAADHLREAAQVVRDRCGVVFGAGTSWDRAVLRAERGIVIGAGLRMVISRGTGGMHMDRMTSGAIDPVVEAIRGPSGEARVYQLARGVSIEVDRDRVAVCVDKKATGSPR